MKNFNGFPRELTDFLIELSFSNTVEKQSENLIKYKKYISEPLNNLYYDLLPIACEINPCLETKPSRCISTPYTDRRFSPNTPLKEYMYLRFRQGGKSKDIAGLYFDMSADYYSYGMRIYKQTSAGFQAVKDYAVDNPEKFEAALEAISAGGFKIIGENYKKNHYPEIKSEVLSDFLNRKTFYIAKDTAINEKVFSSALTEELSNEFFKLRNVINLILDI